MINGVTNPIDATARATARSGTQSGDEARPAEEERPDRTDAVELSEVAREQIEQGKGTPLRTELVERVRAEIAAGTYLTDDKLEAAADSLREALFDAA